MLRFLLGDVEGATPRGPDARYFLAKALFCEKVQERFNRITIDAPPRMTIRFVSALFACTHAAAACAGCAHPAREQCFRPVELALWNFDLKEVYFGAGRARTVWLNWFKQYCDDPLQRHICVAINEAHVDQGAAES